MVHVEKYGFTMVDPFTYITMILNLVLGFEHDSIYKYLHVAKGWALFWFETNKK